MKIKEKKTQQMDMTETKTPAPVAVREHQPETAVAKSHQPVAVGGMSGEFDKEDFRLPRMNIVQSVGDLSEDFPPGSIVLNKESLLIGAAKDPKEWTDPLEITVLSAKKQFQENIEFDSDKSPDVVDSLAEVEERGGWIDWRNDEKPPWRPMLTALLLIKAPNETVADQFSIVAPDGTMYEMVLWTMTGASYSRAGKAILTAGRYSLRNKETGEPQLHHGRWELRVRREKLGTYLVFVPQLKQAGKHADDFITFAESLL